MPKPRLGVPYHPKYKNAAFEQTVKAFREDFNFEIQLLNWQHINEDNAEATISRYGTIIDGLLIPGGHYGPDLKLFGSDSSDNEREIQFKLSLLRNAFNKGMPILGICAGNCFINAALGGSVELLSKKNATPQVNHDIDPLKGELAHSIEIQPDTHLHDILRGQKNKAIILAVNSWHHVANKRIANVLKISGIAPDGVVEAVEMRYPGNPNLWGVQFHPEYVDAKKNPEEYKQQRQILDAFWKAAVHFKYKSQVNQQIIEHHAALKIQSFFASHRKKKEAALQRTITNSPDTRLLKALQLRFECMRAVAAAKFPINKPLDDQAQIERVINGALRLAKEKGIANLEAIAQIFRHNIWLSTQIQVPYYHLIWKKSYSGAPNTKKLVNQAYAQLCQLVRLFHLPIDHVQGKPCYTSEEVLLLARDIIQYASNTIVEILANPTCQELQEISKKRFASEVEKMLATYMTPTSLVRSKDTIQLFAEKMTECAAMSQSNLKAKL